MPYRLSEDGLCVMKEDEELKCYDNHDDALAYLHALQANVEDAKAAIKAVGDWELDVRAIPFDDKDADGQWFDADTDIMSEHFNAPVPTYYHGIDQPKPVVIGKTARIEKRSDGWWARVVLDKAQALAQKVWEAAKNGTAYASSGSIRHLARLQQNGQMTAYDKRIPGRIAVWPFAELAIFDTPPGQRPASWRAVAYPALKSVYEQAGIDWPDIDNPSDKDAAKGEKHSAAPEQREEQTQDNSNGDNNMEEKDIQALVDQRLEAALKASLDKAEAEAKAKADKQAEIDAAVKAAVDEAEKKHAADRRLPFYGDNAPVVGKFGFDHKFGNLSAADVAFTIDVVKATGKQPSEDAYKACAVKLGDEATKSEYARRGNEALKAAGFAFDGDAVKADELNRSTLTSYGDEWVVTANSSAAWEQIRQNTPVLSRLPSIEVPQGSEAVKIPLESTDPVFYKVAQAASDAATGGLSRPNPTVTSSRLGTSNTTLTVAKMGARQRWTGELDEDSIVPFAPQLRKQRDVVASEYMDHVVLDGDTRATASTNINDIAGTPASTDAFLIANGFRYLALATSGRNRSGGSLDEDDFVETMRLLGTSGGAADPTKCAFIVDPHTYMKMLMEITALKTSDVYPGNPTIQSGVITSIWGYPVIRSFQMGYVYKYGGHTMTGYENKFNTAGKIDQDTSSGANNTTGTILLPRFDRWLFGWKRRMTTEVTRHPEWDGSEIVSLLRFGLIYRDSTNAVACTYNVTL